MTHQVQINAASAVKQLQGRVSRMLDYSPESLEAVEAILADASAQVLTPASKEALIELLGCYILEVGFRQHGGRFSWYEERKQPVLVVGEPEFHVAMIAFDKVRGRLAGDLGDNIPFFYQGFSDRAAEGKRGTHALYV